MARSTGLGTPATRTAERPHQRASQRQVQVSGRLPNSDSGRLTRAAAIGQSGLRLTRRLVALLAVVAILMGSYVTSLRVYFNQRAQLAAIQAEIQANEQRITSLYDELTRWQDPAYVKAQARARLGWVIPGEVGYRIIGPDGKLLGGGTSIDAPTALPPDERPKTCWELLLGSMAAADDPVPVETPEPSPDEADPPR